MSTEQNDFLLRRFTVKPRHLDSYLEFWPDELLLLRKHGFAVHQAYVETDAEPKITMVLSHPDPEDGDRSMLADPVRRELDRCQEPHLFRNAVIRPVRVEGLSDLVTDRTVIMRRYWIVGDWSEFLAIWREIVPVREQYGFEFLFAVADEPKDVFTWAFTFDGQWPDFPAAQRGYYQDPARIRLRGVFDYMADYAIHPARQLVV